MKYAKGTMIIVSGKENYMVVGKWRDAYVLAPQDDVNTEVLIYTEDEIQDEITAGRLSLKE